MATREVSKVGTFGGGGGSGGRDVCVGEAERDELLGLVLERVGEELEC
jgi:hypothetical protein